MKKNILGACVIFVITIALLLMIDDISKHRSAEYESANEIYDSPQNQDIANKELEE